MSYTIEKLSDAPESYTEVGKGPHWDCKRQCLYYADLTTGNLYRYDYCKNTVHRSKIQGEEYASFVIPIDGTTNKFAVGCGRRVVVVKWDGVSPTCCVECALFEVQQEEKFNSNRFNYGKCDPRGRLLAGTMRFGGDEFAQRFGELYKFDKCRKVGVVLTDICIANGMAWNECKQKFYFIDTADFEVKEYDYNLGKGVACNKKVAVDFRKIQPEDHLLPDGMTSDAAGNIYVTTFNGGAIYKIDPNTANVLLKIEFPCKQITSCAFGGPNLDILFVTTSSRGNLPEPAGAVFKVTGLPGKGSPMANLKI